VVRTVRGVKDQGLRKFVAVLAGLAVIYFGVTGHSGTEDGGGLSGGVVLLAVLAGLLVWNLTKPGDKPVK
jgi:hypothetical protein